MLLDLYKYFITCGELLPSGALFFLLSDKVTLLRLTEHRVGFRIIVALTSHLTVDRSDIY